MRANLLLICAAIGFTTTTHAEIWKCTDPDGKTQYATNASDAKGCIPMNLDPVETGPKQKQAIIRDAKPETARDCGARLHDPVECFVTMGWYEFKLCKLKLQLSMMNGDIDPCASVRADRDLSDHYEATLKRHTKNGAAQTLTKDYYAYWKSAMRGLAPASNETRIGYTARIAQFEMTLNERAERLRLER